MFPLMRQRVSSCPPLSACPFLSFTPTAPIEGAQRSNSRSIALPLLTLFPPPLTRFPAFFDPAETGTVLPDGRPLLRAEPGVDASPKFWRTRCAFDIVGRATLRDVEGEKLLVDVY